MWAKYLLRMRRVTWTIALGIQDTSTHYLFQMHSNFNVDNVHHWMMQKTYYIHQNVKESLIKQARQGKDM